MTRPFDKHLDNDELDALISHQGASVPDFGGISDQILEEAQHHVGSCPNCCRKVQKHKSVQSEIAKMGTYSNVPPGPDCVGETEWLDLAAGLIPEAKVRELMKHGAQCRHCGPLLRKAVETLSDDMTSTEKALLASLNSARPDWQKRMAVTLHGNAKARQQKPSWWRELFSWQTPAYAFAVVAVIAIVAWIGVRTLRPPSAEQLLAQAYTEHRTLDVRIPGAKYAAIRLERGTGASNLDKSPALLKAEVLIGENLRRHPNDPAWLQARARADLLDGNYDSAIKSLQRALETEPGAPSLLTDLGSAYFMRAESGDRPIDYGNAIESLGKALSQSPDDPVALFNHALACERMYLYTRAVDDWEHYLRVDPQGEWADDARVRLSAVRDKIKHRENSNAEPLLQPKEFIAALVSQEGKSVSVIDQRIERYLEEALRSWLPQAFRHDASFEETNRALEYLAEIAKKKHEDSWLAEFLGAPASAIGEKALLELLESDNALESGRYGRSIDLAQQSERDFQRSKNEAGQVRAQFSLLMAQVFALRFTDCLETTKVLHGQIAGKAYRWLEAQISIEEGQCLESVSRLQEALQTTLQASEIAKKARYPGLELRAVAFAAGYRSYTNNADDSVRDLNKALKVFWQSDASDTCGQNLYSTLSDIADETNRPYLDALALSEISSQFPTKDPTDRAVREQIIAEARERAGDYEGAQRSLQSAALGLGAIPDDKAVAPLRAEIALEGAMVQLHLGRPQDAISTLAGLRQIFENSSAGLLKAQYFQTYGEAFLALGQIEAAEPMLGQSVVAVEKGLKNLSSEAEKLSWIRLEDQIYRDMLQVKLNSHSADEAFSWWERYRGAALRSTTLDDSSTLGDLPERAQNLRLSHDTAVVSYAVLNHAIAVFVVRDGNVHVTKLSLPIDIKELSTRFVDNCSDPTADLELLRTEGRRLYDILVAPLESQLEGAIALRLEPDGVLDQIPFNLLQDTRGGYLGDKFEVVFSQGSAYGLRASSQSNFEPITPTSSALIVAASGSQDSALPVLTEATEEGRDIASYFQQPIVVLGTEVDRKEVLSDLRDAQLFHFAGHAVANESHVGLLLGKHVILNARDLVQWRPRHLQLAVLSACETASGEGGGFTDISSLARTLVAVGVPEVVASRWRVDSEVTHRLMRAFYSNLMSGQSAASSLRVAGMTIRKLPEYQHPYYWASFAVFGSF